MADGDELDRVWQSRATATVKLARDELKALGLLDPLPGSGGFSAAGVATLVEGGATPAVPVSRELLEAAVPSTAVEAAPPAPARPRPFVDDVPRTAFASLALEFSELFRLRFSSTTLAGQVPRVVRLEVGDRETTGGGKQARQAILLQADRTQDTLVAGFVDIGQSRAQLRSHQDLEQLHRRRFGIPLDLERDAYDAWLADLGQFLRKLQVAVELKAPGEHSGAHEPLSDSLVAAAQGERWAWLLQPRGIAAITVVLALVLFLAIRR